MKEEAPPVRLLMFVFSFESRFLSARILQSVGLSIFNRLLANNMANQVSVAESIARVSTAGFELAQQLYVASEEEVRNSTKEMDALRGQLQNLDLLLGTICFDEMSHLYAFLQVLLFSLAKASQGR